MSPRPPPSVAPAGRRRDVWVVVPAYNEGGILADTLAGLVTLPYSVVLVDDGSIDDTRAIGLSYPCVVLAHPVNLGQGAALQTGISYALAQPDTAFVVTFDADGQHDVRDIDRLLAPVIAGTHDVVLGSRFAAGGGTHDMSFSRRALLRAAVLFTRLTTGLNVTDTHNGMRAFTAVAASRLDLKENRMSHASEILSRIAADRVRYCEVGVTVRYTPYSRRKGQAMVDTINILFDSLSARLR